MQEKDSLKELLSSLAKMPLPESRALIRSQVEPPPTLLERIFDTQNAARVSVFDASSDHSYEGGISSLIYRYSPLFGTGELGKRPDVLNLSSLEEEHDRYGKDTDSWRMKYIREEEAHKMAELFFSPPTELSRIKERQEFFETLSKSDQLDELIRLKNDAYKVLEGVGNLNASPSTHGMDERSLIRMLYEGETEVKVYDYEWAVPDEYIRKDPLKPDLEFSVAAINQGLSALEKLANCQDPSFLAAFPDILIFTGKIKSLISAMVAPDLGNGVNRGYPTDEMYAGEISDIYWENANRYYDYDPMSILEDGIIEPYLLRMGAALEFAKKIRDEGWAKATFDSDKRFGYQKGWNIEKPKKEQVKNDGPDDSPIVLLSGANTSGKSFAMKSDFLIRIAGQSLGFVPAESANFRPFESFIFIDRGATDSSNDLSAFMREVKNWKAALSAINSRSRLYIDEGYSTTSPHDQAQLLFATAEYIKQNGGSTVLATHNDMVIARAEANPGVQIYHLFAEVGENGELVRHFLLKKGRSESHSLAVARMRKFPQEALKWVEAYLKKTGLLPLPNSGSNYQDLEKFSEEEREREKAKTQSLDHLFPAKPVNPLFHLLSLDPDFQIGRIFSHVAHGRKEDIKRFISIGRQKELLGKMVLWATELSSKSVFERQKLFQELLDRKIWEKLHVAVENAMALDDTFRVLRNSLEEGLNQTLNPFKQRHPDVSHNPQFSTESLDMAIAFLKIQQKISRGSPQFNILLDKFLFLASVYKQAAKRTETVTKATELTDEEKDLLMLSVDSKGEIPDKATIGDLEGMVEKLFAQVRDIGKDLPIVTLDRINVPEVRKELKKMKDYSGVANAIDELSGNLKKARSLIDLLRTTDSVYLHQAANFLQKQIDDNLALLNGEVLESPQKESEIKNPERAKFNHIGRRGLSVYGLVEELEEESPYMETIHQLDALCLFADIISSERFARVEFNRSGDVELRNAFSIFKKRNQEVGNTVSMNAERRTQILTGPNGSGKTFYEKGAVASVLMGLATGYAPAESATMPIFDSVVYLDRVTEKQDAQLSAFSQELEYWKVLLSFLSTKKTLFAALDEAFSTTSPLYQSAFTFAGISEFMQSPHFLILATHNHEVVSYLQNARFSSLNPYHFKFSISDGKIKYDYKIQEGHEESHALEVAKTMGLPDDILSKAAGFYGESTPNP